MRLILTAVLMLVPASALGHASGPCGLRPAFLKFLADRYDEVPAARGITASGGHIVELVTSRDRERCTIILIDTGAPTRAPASARREEQ